MDLKDNLRVVRGGRHRSDAASFEKLYRENYDAVYNFVNYRMAGAEGVEDIVSEAFLKAARAFDRFDPSRAKFSTWVISIAVNCMKSSYRKARPTVPIEEVSPLAFSQEAPQKAVDDELLVKQLLSVLSEEERELVFLKYYEGMRNVDIAEELGMNLSTVSTRLSRAMSKMRMAANKPQTSQTPQTTLQTPQ